MFFCSSALAQARCPVVDLMPEFWRAVAQSKDKPPQQRIETFRNTIVVKHDDLYHGALGFASDEELNAAIQSSTASAESDRDSLAATREKVLEKIPAAVEKFQRAFPDFHCDFPIYVVHSLNRLDGAGRVVDHRPALVLGVDVIAAQGQNNRYLDLLLAHELFHRYHFQASGFSDDNAQKEVIWKGLWVEGSRLT